MKPLARSLCALALLSSLGAAHAAPPPPPVALFGEAAPVDKATRSIVVLPTTKYVNVKQGEVIKFVVDGAEFAFSFNSPNTTAFNLQRVAPVGTLDHAVTTYILRDPDIESLLGR